MPQVQDLPIPFHEILSGPLKLRFTNAVMDNFLYGMRSDPRPSGNRLTRSMGMKSDISKDMEKFR